MKWEKVGRKSMKWEQECHDDEEAKKKRDKTVKLERKG